MSQQNWGPSGGWSTQMGASGAGGNRNHGHLPNQPMHTSNHAQSTSASGGGNQPAGAHLIGSPAAQRANPRYPKAVVDAANMVAMGVANLWEQAEQYSISKFGNAKGAQNPVLGDIGVRGNPVNQNLVDNRAIYHDIVWEAPNTPVASAMMATYPGRVFLTTRVLVKHLIKDILHMRCFSPIADNMTRQIDEVDRRLEPSAPAAIKQIHLSNVGNTMRQLRGTNHRGQPNMVEDLSQDPKFEQRREPKGISNSRAEAIWPTALALFPEKRTNDWRDLHYLVKKGMMLVFDLYGSGITAEYSFVWPESGDRFDAATMVARANLFDGRKDLPGYTAQELMGSRIAFVMTPVVEQKVYYANGMLETKILVKAQVTF